MLFFNVQWDIFNKCHTLKPSHLVGLSILHSGVNQSQPIGSVCFVKDTFVQRYT